MIKGLQITPLNIIETPGGNVLHAMKNIDAGFIEFGEVYFKEVEPGSINAWKRHREMTLNIVVPIGHIKFILFDDRDQQKNKFQEVIISRENYCRLTLPPMIWMGFQALSVGKSLLVNIANIKHEPTEIDKKNIEEIEFNWNN